MNKNLSAGLVFLISFAIGIFLSAYKPLWTDELYALRSSVMEPSYSDILLRRTDSLVKEGNSCPLFYITEKLFCNLVGYQLPESLLTKWKKVGHTPGFYEELYSQIVVRFQPVFFMSLAVSAIFFYFARFYSWWAAIYSFFVSFSSYMVLIYIAEARPYALWIFLTTLQLLIFMWLCRKEGSGRRAWAALTVVHFLLSFTIVFSMAQVFIVSALLFILRERDWRNYILLTIFPCLIAFLYSLKLPHFHYWFWHGPRELLSANYPSDRLIIVVAYAILLIFCALKKNMVGLLCGSMKEGYPVFLYFLGMLAVAVAIIVSFKRQAVVIPVPGDPTPNFPVPARYFLFLVPVSIVATTLFSTLLVRSFRFWPGLQASGVVILILLLGFRFERSQHNAKMYYPRLFHVPSMIEKLEQ